MYEGFARIINPRFSIYHPDRSAVGDLSDTLKSTIDRSILSLSYLTFPARIPGCSEQDGERAR